jgi:hypothetical protein
MAIRTSWKEFARLLAEADVRANDAATVEAYRWQLLEVSARLSTTRLIINQPTPTLDETEARLLEPLEAASNESLARFLADLAPGIEGSQGRTR